MARRGGKAASRQSRQRRAQRAAQRATQRPVAPDRATAEPRASGDQGPDAPGDAFEKADAEVRAASTADASRRAGPPRRQRAAEPRYGTTGPSRLSERAAADYHYVGRDLRNIGVLTVIMVVLLLAATVAVNMLGIGPT